MKKHIKKNNLKNKKLSLSFINFNKFYHYFIKILNLLKNNCYYFIGIFANLFILIFAIFTNVYLFSWEFLLHNLWQLTIIITLVLFVWLFNFYNNKLRYPYYYEFLFFLSMVLFLFFNILNVYFILVLFMFKPLLIHSFTFFIYLNFLFIGFILSFSEIRKERNIRDILFSIRKSFYEDLLFWSALSLVALNSVLITGSWLFILLFVFLIILTYISKITMNIFNIK